MEKVTEYKLTLEDGEKHTREVFYNDEFEPVILHYTDGKAPSDAMVEALNSGVEFNEGGYNAAWLKLKLNARNYAKLYSQNKIILDFLNARLGD